ncbi:MAG TPA: hypothetical protein VKY89_15080 [Thermoanaerobaculia bacterium]|nr:hypothetical protein [Thermoanaerobaculia bacterium]
MSCAAVGANTVAIAVGGQGARLRAAVDRLHAAQLAALAAGPPAGRDAYGAERQLLEQLGEMGALLVRLARADAEAAELRRRLVALAVAGANTLAELVSLAFEVECRGGEEPCAAAAADPEGQPWRCPERPGELWRALLLQVAALLPLVAALEAGALSGAGAEELGRLAATAANHLAAIRSCLRVWTG